MNIPLTIPCLKCKGEGSLKCRDYDSPMVSWNDYPCPDCAGKVINPAILKELEELRDFRRVTEETFFPKGTEPMEIEFARKSFLNAFKDARAIAPSRSPKPILQSVKLVVKEGLGPGFAELAATDLEVSIERRVQVDVQIPGIVMLPADAFMKVLTTGDDKEPISLRSDDEHNLTAWYGPRSSIKLVSSDPELFPSVGFESGGVVCKIRPADLAKAIKRTIFAVEEESTRYALGGVLFSVSDGKLTLVATNGRHLAFQEIEYLSLTGTMPEGGHYVVPAKALKLAGKESTDAEMEIEFLAGDSAKGSVPKGIAFRTEDSTIHSRLVEGRFPSYRDVFPAAPKAVVEIAAGDLLKAVSKAEIVTSEESSGVDFRFAEGRLTLTSESADLGKAFVETVVSESIEPIEVTLAVNYLVQMLRSLEENVLLRVELIDGKSAVVFRTGDGYSYVLMPLTRDR